MSESDPSFASDSHWLGVDSLIGREALDGLFSVTYEELRRLAAKVKRSDSGTRGGGLDDQRSQTFLPQNPMSRAALLAALRDKYGKETLTNDRGGGGLFLYWIFDQSGKLLPAADMALTACSGTSFAPTVGNGTPPSQNPVQQGCFRSFFAVTAQIHGGDQLLTSYSVELVNLPYAFKAATATANAKAAAAEQSRRNQIEKGDQNKPQF